jgi:pimeloyl-ACP methyl ester carboxylesterase
MADIIGPTSHYFYSQRLKLHYVDWGNHCRNWDWVALALRRHFHLIAPDLRGHGDSDWAIGGSYAMIDHVLDLYQLMNAVAGGPVTLIGHSLGAGVALQAAGVFPDSVKALVAIEGLGPPSAMLRETPAYERMDHWVGDMRALAQRKPREYPNIEEALERMRVANPQLSPEQARPLTIHARPFALPVQPQGCDRNLEPHPLSHAVGARRRVVGR